MPVKIIDGPKITDQIQIDFVTLDENDNPINPYRVDNVVVYYIERDFTSDSFKSLTETVGNTTSTMYYTDAVPVYSFGNSETPAWDSTDTTDAFITKNDLDDDGNVLIGNFTAIWTPKLSREGDYFVCYTWTPLIASSKLSSYQSFFVYGDTPATTAIPSHQTPIGKYETLLERYLPEMYKLKLAEFDITPDVLSRFHQAVAKGYTTIEDLANQLIDLMDANVCHEAFLPYLANLFRLKLRSSDPTLWRRQIKKAIPTYKKKGTLDGLKDALSSAGITFQKLTQYYQVVSKSTWQEGFVVTENDQTEFTLTKVALLPIDVSNYELKIRYVDTTDYVSLSTDYVTFATTNGITVMTWNPTGVPATPIPLMEGDVVVITYKISTIANQSIENYIRALPLADKRDETLVSNPKKNWNVKLIAQDDAMFATIVPTLHPFAAPIVWGKVRTEFAYSENAYNMEEYNGCAIGTTKICTNRGILQIKDLKNDDLIKTEYGFKSFEKLICHGEKETVTIKMKSGRKITTTKNHNFRVIDSNGLLKWKAASKLNNDDYVLCVKGENSSYVCNDTDDLWYLIGHLYGDGSMYKNEIRWLIANSEIEILPKITKILKNHKALYNIFEITPEKHQPYTQFNCNESMWRIQSSRTQLPKLSNFLPNYEKKGKWKKKLPGYIWTSKKSEQSSFLSGLFDTDGSVQKGNPLLTTKWHNLAIEVQELLLNLGIISTVTSLQTEYKGKKRKYYRVRIIGEKSHDMFKQTIGFRLDSKQIALNEKRSSANVERQEPRICCSDRNIIPYADKIALSIFGEKRKILSENRSSNRPAKEKSILSLITRLKQGYVTVIPNNRAVEILNKALEYGIKNEHYYFLKNYCDNNWFFDKVEKIYQDKPQLVYDPLNVKDTHSYVSNGIVSHNSTRNSNIACDIDGSFVDSCSSCLGSIISVDVEIEDLNNDRVAEATEIIKDCIPFHAQIDSVNFNGSVNEYVIPPVEEVEMLIQFSITENVLIGQGDFTRIIPILNSTSGQILRNMLSTSSTAVSTTSGNAFNDEIVLYCPDYRFDTLGVDTTPNTQNLLQILSGINTGTYNVELPGQNTIKIIQGSPSSIPYPLNTAAFMFNLSNEIASILSADIFQDDYYLFSESGQDFRVLNLPTGSKVVVSGGAYAGSYVIDKTFPDNTLSILAFPSTANVTGLKYSITNSSGSITYLNRIVSGSGKVSVTRRGRVETIDLIEEWDVKQGYYIRYSGTDYKIISFKENTMPYIINYTGGTVAGVPIKVYKRLIDNGIGYVDARGMYLVTSINYEAALDVQNGSNPPTTQVENSSFMENFLVEIDGSYYQITDWNGTRIDLSGPKVVWGLAGTVKNYSIIQYDNTSPVDHIAPDGSSVRFQRIDRRGNEPVSTTTQSASMYQQGMALGAAALNRGNGGSQIIEEIKTEESISYTIEWDDGTIEEGQI